MILKSKIAALLVTVMLIMTLGGCQNASSVQGTTQADLSGELTVYTSQPEADIQALVEKFNIKHPNIQVNVFRSGTEEVVSKILAEKEVDAIQADVLLVADSATFETLKSKDILMSYASHELKGISADYYDKENTYTGTKIISTGIIINTEMVKREIKAFSDLTQDDMKDQLIMPSPLYSGAAAYNLGVIVRTNGLGWEYYESLKNNNITVEKGNGAVKSAVVSGQKAAGIIIDYMAIRAKNEGAPVEFIYPEEGSLIITEPVAIIKDTKNEDLAKAFVDYILSEDGQKATAEIGYTPVKSGVASPEGFKTSDQIKNLTFELSVLVENRDSDKERFSKMFQ
jgi:iron(III) transport system substrate-binding protein